MFLTADKEDDVKREDDIEEDDMPMSDEDDEPSGECGVNLKFYIE